MLAWLGAVPTLVLAVAVVTIPGLPVAWLLRFRGLTLLAASIAASVAIVGLATITAPLIGIHWGILPVLAVTILVCVALLPVRVATRHTGTNDATTPRSALWAAIAIGVATLLIGQEIARAIGSPENISQTYDGVFHVNAAAQIVLSGDASPFHMDLASPGSTGSFYPTLWHALVALIAQLSGASIPTATNAMVLTVSAWIWPIAILFFSRPFFVRRPAHLVLGAILAANFTAFPYLLVAWGVLYPNLLSTALIPLALGFLYPALRYNAIHSLAPLISLWVATVGSIGAALLAHPNALFGIAAFTVPMLIVTANDVRTSHLSKVAKSIRWSAIFLMVILYAVSWNVVRTGDNQRNYDSGLVQAFIDGISNAPMIESRAWFLTILVFGGIVVLLVLRRHRWLILSYAIALGLFVISSGLDGSFRAIFTGAWYNDAHRLASLLPIAAIPLAAAASARLLDYVTIGLQNADPERVSSKVRRFLPAIGAIVVFALILTGARGQSLSAQSGWISDLHDPEGTSELLSADERELLNRLAGEVAPDAIIAGDPWTGTGLALAISQREVLFGHLKGSYGTEALELASEFNQLDQADACLLLNDLGVTHLLDFGRVKYDIEEPGVYAPYRGLQHIGDSPVVTEIDREGSAALFLVDCD